MRTAQSAELRRRRLVVHLLLAGGVLACALLLICPPTRFGFYPACPIHRLLGIQCPGCGATRALAALLRGHLIEALRLNALFVLLLPAALAGAVESYRRAMRPGVFRWPQPPAPALYATLAAAALFTIVRNVVR
jgi:hypothetical protein